MKILTISDSFKGTMTSSEVGKTVSEYYQNKGYIANYIPISDGGEGFLEVISYINKLEYNFVEVFDPIFRKTQAKYLYDNIKKVAYLELAEASGLIKVEKKERNAVLASTYGLGQLIKYVISHHHPKRIVLGIGGSATSDMGTGMLEALGVEFFDANNFIIKKMNNVKLMQVRKVKLHTFRNLIKGIEFITLTDVNNPLIGEHGCINVFAKQKGATDEQLLLMEKNILHFYHKTLDKIKNASDFNGAGAAGGVGYTMKYYFNSKILSGIDTILELVNFKEEIKKYDIIISGEGHLDSQSLNGKVISGIKKYQPKRLILITGFCSINTKEEVYAIVPNITNLEESMEKPVESLLKLLGTIDIDKKQ